MYLREYLRPAVDRLRAIKDTRVPRHIGPANEPEKGAFERWELHARMMQLNPKGWRTPGKKRGVTKPLSGPKHHNGLTRLERLAKMATEGAR